MNIVIKKNTKGVNLISQASEVEVTRKNAVQFIALEVIFKKLAKKAKDLLAEEEHDFILDEETEIAVNRSSYNRKNPIKTEEMEIHEEILKELKNAQIESGNYTETPVVKYLIDKGI